MSTKPNRTSVLDELDEVLRESVERIRDQSPPTAAMTSTLTRVASLCEQQKQPSAASSGSVFSIVSRRGIGLIGGMTAASIMLAVLLLSDPAPSLAADVTESLAKCNWVHVVQVREGQVGRDETWFSFKDDISIRSTAKYVEFRGHRDLEFKRYERSEKTLYHLSERGTPRRFNPLSSFADALPLLVNDDPDDASAENIPLLKQLGRDVQIGGHRVIRKPGFSDVVVDLKVDGRAIEAVIAVDDATKLPQSFEIKSREGKEVSLLFQFDYPTEGPKNVYALGVPADAKVVDRVPRKNEEFLLAAVKNGGLHFDDYRALAITYDPDDKLWWVNARKELIYRKGNKWRRNHLFISFHPDIARTTPDEAVKAIRASGPEDGTNLADWWTVQLKDSPDPEGKLSEIFVGSDQAVARYSVVPEFHARPPMGQTGLDYQVSVEADPGHGPDGTILIECSKIKTAKGDLDETPAKSQFWIDPRKGHLVTRMQTLDSDGELIDRTDVESTSQTNDGKWYPTKVRRESRMDGEMSVETTEYFLTFPDEIPDALFEGG